MTEPLHSIEGGLLDLVYPPKCLVCRTLGGEYLCDSCAAGIRRVPRPYCPCCGHPMRSEPCHLCWGRVRSFTAARAVGEYGGTLREAIHAFKYGGHRVLAAPLAHLLHEYLTKSADIPWGRAQLIVPVPIHPVRRRLRGYNQSELLAEELGGMIGLPVGGDAVSRIVRTHPQVELSGDERRGNVKNAFRATRPDALRGKTVLLIDDVATTCSTIHECSHAILRAGAERVYAVCLAFGS